MSTLAANAVFVAHYFKDDSLENLLITTGGSVAGIAGGSLPVTVQMGASLKLVFSGVPNSLGVHNTCYGPYTIASQDSGGNATAISATDPTTVTLASKAFNTQTATGAFYSDACVTTTTTVTIAAAATSSGQFWFKDATARQEAWTATATGVAGAYKTLANGATTGMQLAFTAGTASFATGTCTQFTVATQDVTGAAKSTSITIAIGGGGNGTFHG